ncbi:MAG: 2-hydroxychromene-2-carboxylate isomerase [Pseudomonadota bacterium]
MSTNFKYTVQFYFDPISPFAWLASRDLQRLQEAGVQIDCRPVLFAGLLNAHGQKGPAEIPAKRVYTFHDVLRQATQHGYIFKGPPSHPFNPLRALRMCIALADAQERLRFAQALMIACWEQGADLSDAKVLDEIAQAAGFDGRLSAAADMPEVKEKLLLATENAIKNGIFGVPTFVLGKELFWGSDRIDALLWRLDHPDEALLESEILQDFLQRGASAQRRQ